MQRREGIWDALNGLLQSDDDDRPLDTLTANVNSIMDFHTKVVTWPLQIDIVYEGSLSFRSAPSVEALGPYSQALAELQELNTQALEIVDVLNSLNRVIASVAGLGTIDFNVLAPLIGAENAQELDHQVDVLAQEAAQLETEIVAAFQLEECQRALHTMEALTEAIQ